MEEICTVASGLRLIMVCINSGRKIIVAMPCIICIVANDYGIMKRISGAGSQCQREFENAVTSFLGQRIVKMCTGCGINTVMPKISCTSTYFGGFGIEIGWVHCEIQVEYLTSIWYFINVSVVTCG
ncbi:hypothetical protein DSECCO2_544260 [anaerobic digester metagenome]